MSANPPQRACPDTCACVSSTGRSSARCHGYTEASEFSSWSSGERLEKTHNIWLHFAHLQNLVDVVFGRCAMEFQWEPGGTHSWLILTIREHQPAYHVEQLKSRVTVILLLYYSGNLIVESGLKTGIEAFEGAVLFQREAHRVDRRAEVAFAGDGELLNDLGSRLKNILFR